MNLNVNTKAKIHNKFHIEVRNAHNGELEEEGFAENIVLDKMYSDLVNFRSVFDGIRVGSGVGTPSPDRDNLFNQISGTGGSFAIEETIRSYPISSVTKSITLPTTSRANGNNITEVGITGYDELLTHAMIKDAEGNPLSVHKDELNIITIYATLYLELVEDPNSVGVLSKSIDNPLITYVILGHNHIAASSAPYNDTGFLYSASDYGDRLDRRTIASSNTYFAEEDTVDVPNRKRSISARVGTSGLNGEIMELAVNVGGSSYRAGVNTRYRPGQEMYKIKLDGSQIWQPFQLNDINVGIGDGESTEFTLPHHRMLDVDVNVNGLSTNSYSILNNDRYGGDLPLHSAALEGSEVLESWADVSTMYKSISSNYGSMLVDPDKLSGKSISITPSLSWPKLEVTLENGSSRSLTDGDKFPDNVLSFDSTSHSIIAYIVDPLPTLVLNSPPAEGELVTVSYKVPYIPKSEDYVLDIEAGWEWV